MALTQISQAGAKDEAINEAKIQISNSGTNGQYLQKQSGNTGGLTWADVPAGVGGGTGLDVNDSVKIRLGTGNDVELYHDGSNSYLTNSTGALILQTGNLQIKNAAGNESLIRATADGNAELYHNNVLKVETTSDGAKITSSAHDAGLEIVAGNNNQETRIHLQGKSSGGTAHDWYLGAARSSDSFTIHDGTDTGIAVRTDGATELYYDGGKRLQTGAGGLDILGDEGEDCDVHIYADEGDDAADKWRLHVNAGSSTFRVDNQASGSWEKSIECTGDGAVQLYHDGTKKFETYSGGTNIPDGAAYTAGASNDVQLYHSGGNGYLSNNTGTYHIRSNVIAIQNNGGDHNYLTIANEAGVSLYYDDSKKLETTSAGAKVTGALEGDSDLLLRPAAGNNNVIMQPNSGSETLLKATVNGAVELYYDNSKKLETISTGVNITGGIRLGGNNAVNELDDYEEGTWSPALVGGTSAGSGTYSTQAGWYVKIGNTVTCGGFLIWSAHSGSGNMRINNFPFSRKSGVNYETVGHFVTSNWDYNSGEQTVGYMGDSNIMYFRQTYDNEVWQGVQHDSNAELMFSITYQTT